jgi:transcriptional regulator with XRE-family HTH domain
MALAEHTTTDDTGWVPVDTFGARLILIRQRFHWNVSEAAAHCGIGRSSWDNWEKGKPCSDMENVARQIADATGCSYTWLMAGGNLGNLRSRCVWNLDLAPGQLELALDIPEPDLVLVGP